MFRMKNHKQLNILDCQGLFDLLDTQLTKLSLNTSQAVLFAVVKSIKPPMHLFRKEALLCEVLEKIRLKELYRPYRF